MAEPHLIGSYLAVLAAELPASIVEELADGLAETHESYLRRGLTPDRAAEAAVAEFGEPKAVVAAFARVNPARRAARRLLGIGPAVGACWVVALVTVRSGAWRVPLPVGVLLGLVLLAAIGLLATSALGRHYRAAARAGIAGCLGMAAIDITLIVGVLLLTASFTWALAAAMAASTARITFTVRALRPALAS